MAGAGQIATQHQTKICIPKTADNQSCYLPISAFVNRSFASVGVLDNLVLAADGASFFLVTRFLHFSSQ